MPHRTVRDVMTKRALHQPPATNVCDAIRLMAEHNVSSVLVCEAGQLLGIFTERDAVRRVLAPGRDPNHTPLAEVMTRDPDTICPEEGVDEAIRRMDEFGYRHLAVVENGGGVIGVLSLRDCPIDDLASMAYELEQRHVIAERAW